MKDMEIDEFKEIRLQYLGSLRKLSKQEYDNFRKNVLFSVEKPENLLVHESTGWVFSVVKEVVYFLFGNSGYDSTFGFLSYALDVRKDAYSFQRGGFFSSSTIKTPKGYIGIKNKNLEEIQSIFSDFVEYHKRRDNLIEERERIKRFAQEEEKARMKTEGNKLLDNYNRELEILRSRVKDLKELDLSPLSKRLKIHADRIHDINPEYLQKLVRLKNYLENEIRNTSAIKNRWTKKKVSLTWDVPCPDGEELDYFYAFVLKGNQNQDSKLLAQGYREKFRRKYKFEHFEVCEKVTLDGVTVNNKPIVVPKKFNESWTKIEYNFIVQRYGHINRLMVFGLIMIDSLLMGSTYVFYELYEKCDRFGVFNNNWENQINQRLSAIGDKMDMLNSNVVQLIEVLREVEGNIVSELQALESSLKSEINGLDNKMGEINSNIKESMGELNAKISYGNLLATYNSYQLYKIRG